MHPEPFAESTDLIAVRLGPLVLTVAHGRAHWHALDAWGPWWPVRIGKA